MNVDIFIEAKKQGFDITKLKENYKEWLKRIRYYFPPDSSKKILEDMTFEKYVKSVLSNKKTEE